MNLLSAMAVALVLTGGSADALEVKTVAGLELRIPRVWKHSVEAGTWKWVAPSNDATFSLDAFPWQGEPITGEACRDKLVKALGGQGWENTDIGNAPAAKRLVTDRLEDKKTDVQTRSWVGCNGRTKWVLTFSSPAKKSARYGELAEKIAKSIRYESVTHR